MRLQRASGSSRRSWLYTRTWPPQFRHCCYVLARTDSLHTPYPAVATDSPGYALDGPYVSCPLTQRLPVTGYLPFRSLRTVYSSGPWFCLYATCQFWDGYCCWFLGTLPAIPAVTPVYQPLNRCHYTADCGFGCNVATDTPGFLRACRCLYAYLPTYGCALPWTDRSWLFVCCLAGLIRWVLILTS